MNADILLWSLRNSDALWRHRAKKLLRPLTGPDCDEDSAVAVLANLIRNVWLNGFLYHQKLWVVDLVLKTLTTGRSAGRSVNKLKAALRMRLSLVPQILNPVLESIEIWAKQLQLQSGRIVDL